MMAIPSPYPGAPCVPGGECRSVLRACQVLRGCGRRQAPDSAPATAEPAEAEYTPGPRARHLTCCAVHRGSPRARARRQTNAVRIRDECRTGGSADAARSFGWERRGQGGRPGARQGAKLARQIGECLGRRAQTGNPAVEEGRGHRAAGCAILRFSFGRGLAWGGRCSRCSEAHTPLSANGMPARPPAVLGVFRRFATWLRRFLPRRPVTRERRG